MTKQNRRPGGATTDCSRVRSLHQAECDVIGDAFLTPNDVFYVRNHGLAESLIADQFEPLPPNMPFRILHQRHSDYGLNEAIRRMRLFTDENLVHFLGAGEQPAAAATTDAVGDADPVYLAMRQRIAARRAEVLKS